MLGNLSIGSRRSRRPVLLWATVVVFGGSLTAHGHAVRVSAHVHDGVIHGEAHFADDTPVRGAVVRAFDPADEEIGKTTTDEKGEFSLKAEYRCEHRLLVDTGDGHGAEYTVRATQLPAELPSRGGGTASPRRAGDPLEDIRHEMVHLGERLDRYEQSVRLRDVLGGIGYILGLGGVAFYFLGVRRKESRG